ncbi:uncharacterized protein LOC111008108 isoform X3 [Momordica charantia]|uniref:Uncharacterized protein LOC111008108 isoform X3 n=1 Tax=Momordica charantia TaxID=3673 RepID=A0A6J1C3D6_MOMCH|nr:uncharacterized protein LOC111008108 isoform X3 [Momordica charantia]
MWCFTTIPHSLAHSRPSSHTCFILVFISLASFCLSLPSRLSGLMIYMLKGLSDAIFLTSWVRRDLLPPFHGDPHIIPTEYQTKNTSIHVNLEKSSSAAVYEYFSTRLVDMETPCGSVADLLEPKDRSRVEMVLKYIEDGDLRRWSLPGIRAFNIGLSEWRSKLNCITNPYMYEQLLEMNSLELIAKGNDFIASCDNAANKFLDKTFKIRLGRGLYGECLAVRADGSSNLSDEIGKQLSMRSAAAGLRPIGAVIYMQRNNLKMCLRTTDGATDTSEVSKAYGGGGSPRSSSFTIRMDEYNRWRSF